MKKTKLADWCRDNQVSYRYAEKLIRKGEFPHPILHLSERVRLVVEPSDLPAKYVAYARVSGSRQQDSLKDQESRIREYAADNGLQISATITEIGSGLNDGRKKWNRLLADPTITHIIVEHRDRATRFGFDQLSSSLKASNREIIVIDQSELEDDLIRDMTEILTSMCARLYGKRGAAIKAKKASQVMLHD